MSLIRLKISHQFLPIHAHKFVSSATNLTNYKDLRMNFQTKVEFSLCLANSAHQGDLNK